MEAAQPTSQPPAKRISVSEVIGETFSTYRQNIGALLGSALVIFVVVGLVAGLLQESGGLLLVLIAAAVRIAGYALYTGFVVKLVQDVRDGRRDQAVGDLFSAATPYILPLIGFGILFGIGVTIGLILIVVPGLIALTLWSVGAPAIVVEGIGPIDAFGRSRRLVRGDAWPVFGTLIVTYLIVLVIEAILVGIGSSIGGGAAIVASIVSATITAPIYALAVSVLYFDLGDGGVAAGTVAPPPPPTEPPPPPPAEPPPAAPAS
jgi:hypothetical protein